MIHKLKKDPTTRRAVSVQRVAKYACVLFVGGCLLISCSSGKKTVQVAPVAEAHAVTPPDTVSSVDPFVEVPAPRIPSAWVVRDMINVRSEPSTQSKIVAQLHRGAQVAILEQGKDWWKVLLDDGTPAYIHASLLTEEPYVEPWQRFKLEAKRADSSLDLIVAVDPASRGVSGDPPAVVLTVAPRCGAMTPPERTELAEAAFRFWRVCLEKCGYDAAKSSVTLRDSQGQTLATVRLAAGKPQVTLR